MLPPDDRADVDDLFRVVYDELRTLARRQIARLNPGQTLSPTALVHDVYLRMADRSSGRLRDEQHFRALAARVMRQVIIDYIRRRTAQKRGAGIVIDGLVSDIVGSATSSNEELLAIDEALVKLAALDARHEHHGSFPGSRRRNRVAEATDAVVGGDEHDRRAPADR